MKSYRIIVFILIASAFLTACSNAIDESEAASSELPATDLEPRPATQESVLAPTEPIRPEESAIEQMGDSSGDKSQALWPDGEVKLDEQGYVEVAVTPLNLNSPDGTLNFSVGLNTHSVDLSMDLSAMATLEADNGLGVDAVTWDAPSGGHHVSGILSFPTIADGVALLDGASHLTLKIHNVDAPERIFTWTLTG